jgi:hypothetical protein
MGGNSSLDAVRGSCVRIGVVAKYVGQGGSVWLLLEVRVGTELYCTDLGRIGALGGGAREQRGNVDRRRT